MSPLYTYNNKLLVVDSALAADPKCCCGGGCSPCLGGIYTRTMTIRVEGVTEDPDCTMYWDDNCVNGLNGFHSFQFSGPEENRQALPITCQTHWLYNLSAPTGQTFNLNGYATPLSVQATAAQVASYVRAAVLFSSGVDAVVDTWGGPLGIDAVLIRKHSLNPIWISTFPASGNVLLESAAEGSDCWMDKITPWLKTFCGYTTSCARLVLRNWPADTGSGRGRLELFFAIYGDTPTPPASPLGVQESEVLSLRALFHPPVSASGGICCELICPIDFKLGAMDEYNKLSPLAPVAVHCQGGWNNPAAPDFNIKLNW